MEFLNAFLVSVMASVVGYYLCKWLDGNGKDDDQPKRNPGELQLSGVSLYQFLNAFLAICIIADFSGKRQ